MKTRSDGGFLLAFGILALLFVGSTFVVNGLRGDIEDRFEAASSDALPSIVHLTAACDALRDLEALSDDYPDLPADQRDGARKQIEGKWSDLDVELTSFLGLPAYAGERELYESEVPSALRDVDMTLDHLFAQVEAKQAAAARETAGREVRVAANRAAKSLRKVVSFNAGHAEDELNRIAATHRRASHWSLVLDGVAVLCGAVLAYWVFRRFRAHDTLLVAHNALIEQRAADLEVFASRIAHDLLSPLSALTYCLGAFKRAGQADPKLQDALTRARSCVARAQAMVHGIFEFSRAGGEPDAGGRADLREAVEQVAEEVRTVEATERPEVIVEPFESCTVACAPGVLGSVLANLLRNAAKYMSDSAVKQITVRVRDNESRVRVEVEDTGPGIPQGLATRIFEPYVRAEGVTQPGLGLGLATVKRLCEAHGGCVGVRSRPGEGSVFWFSLPKASSADPVGDSLSAPLLRRIS